MKKILLPLLLYPSVVYAEKINKDFYLKLNVAGNNVIFFKEHSHISPEISAGAGYYFNDFYRADIVAGHSSFSSDDKHMAYEETLESSSVSGTKKISYKAQSQYLLLTNYINIIRNDNFQIYVSGGVGLGKIKERANHFFSGLLINGDIVSVPLNTDHYISKSTKHFIYSLGLGASTRINSNVNLDVAYSYKDFGKPNYKPEDMRHILSNKPYRLHNMSIGIRFDL